MNRRSFLKATAASITAMATPASVARAIPSSRSFSIPFEVVAGQEANTVDAISAIGIINAKTIADIQRIEDQRFIDLLEAM